jgi:hypothetical protein
MRCKTRASRPLQVWWPTWVGNDGTLRTSDLPLRGRTTETYEVNRSRVLYAFKALDRDGRLPDEAKAFLATRHNNPARRLLVLARAHGDRDALAPERDLVHPVLAERVGGDGKCALLVSVKVGSAFSIHLAPSSRAVRVVAVGAGARAPALGRAAGRDGQARGGGEARDGGPHGGGARLASLSAFRLFASLGLCCFSRFSGLPCPAAPTSFKNLVQAHSFPRRRARAA